MKPWSEKWIKTGLQTGAIDLPRFTRGMRSAYECANLKWHNNVVVVPNPLVLCLASPLANYMLKKSVAVDNAVVSAVRSAVDNAVVGAVGDAVVGAVGDAVHSAVVSAVRSAVVSAVGDAVVSAVRDAVVGAVGEAVGDAVGDAVDNAVDNAVGEAVGDAVHSAVGDAVDNAVGEAVDNAVGEAVDNAVRGVILKNWNNFLGGQFWVGGWYWSNAYVTFLRDVCGLELNEKITKAMSAYEDINSSACWSYPSTGFTMVCERPTYIKRDEQGRLHSENSSSIKWDGFELFHWHGVSIPEDWVTGKKPTTSEALNWQNLEQRRAACELVGWNNILAALNSNVIDKDDDPEIGTLLECDIPDSGKERFLQVQCGTKREFVLHVPKEMKTALESQAWMFQINVKDFIKPEVRT